MVSDLAFADRDKSSGFVVLDHVHSIPQPLLVAAAELITAFEDHGDGITHDLAGLPGARLLAQGVVCFLGEIDRVRD